MAGTAEKARELRLGRAAQRQGFAVARSRTRVPEAADFGMYAIADAHTNTWEVGIGPTGHSMTIDDVEEWLTASPAARNGG